MSLKILNSNLIALYGDNHMKYMNTLRGHNTQFLEVKFGDTSRNHCILRYTDPMFMSVLCSSQLDPLSTDSFTQL